MKTKQANGKIETIQMAKLKDCTHSIRFQAKPNEDGTTNHMAHVKDVYVSRLMPDINSATEIEITVKVIK